jgi:ComF family protein
MKMYPITRAKLWLRALISGEKCIACGEMKTKGESLLCPECEDDLKRSHLLICPDCGAYARDCLCSTQIMREAGLDVLIKYAFYDASDKDAALNRIIRRLKRIPDRLAFAYFAAILSRHLSVVCNSRGYTKDNTLVVHIPRSRKTIARDGHDQAELFAAAVAKRMSFPHRAVIKRLKHGKAQKYLHIDERIENVKGMFCIKNAESVKGKNIILADDLVTTGATVSEAARTLFDAGALAVVCICIANSDKLRK